MQTQGVALGWIGAAPLALRHERSDDMNGDGSWIGAGRVGDDRLAMLNFEDEDEGGAVGFNSAMLTD